MESTDEVFVYPKFRRRNIERRSSYTIMWRRRRSMAELRKASSKEGKVPSSVATIQ
jgi:hypothetical protein